MYGEPLGIIPAEFADVIASGRPIVGEAFPRPETRAEQEAKALQYGEALLKVRRLARLGNRWQAKRRRQCGA